jgi:hypothetical protein
MEIVAFGFRLESQTRLRFNQTAHWFTSVKKRSRSVSFAFLAKWLILLLEKCKRRPRWRFSWKKCRVKIISRTLQMEMIQTANPLRSIRKAIRMDSKTKVFTSSKTKRYHNSSTAWKTTPSGNHRLQRLFGTILPTLKLKFLTTATTEFRL